jgi:sec-independent protein translocase protein TatB
MSWPPLNGTAMVTVPELSTTLFVMVIAVVALIVIGPERLPKVARTLGMLFGRMQRYVNDVKADINREMALDDLRKLQSSIQDTARTIEQSMNQEVGAAQQVANELNTDMQAALPTLNSEAMADSSAVDLTVVYDAATTTQSPGQDISVAPLPQTPISPPTST